MSLPIEIGHMRKLLLTILFFISISVFSQITKTDTWDEAQKIALSENKDILIEFTGSSWCKPCIRMEKEVLSDPKFEEFAKDKFVLFVLDLQMPIKVDSENYQTFERYKKIHNVSFYPTYILTDSDGKEKTRLKGYYSLNNFIKKLSK